MILTIFDTMTAVLQSIFLAYTIVYCIERDIKKVKVFGITSIFIFISTFFGGTFGDNSALGIILIHGITLCIISLIYRKNITSALTAYTISYSIFAIYSMFFGNLFFEYIRGILPIEYSMYVKIFIMHIPEWILIYICLRYLHKIKEIYKLVLYEKFSISIIIMSFFVDFLLTFYLITLSDRSQLLKNIIYILFFVFFVVILAYFWKIHQKSEQIYKLNNALEIKNNELRKIKHDYGAQISYLYGLGLMERFDDLKQSLKDIINNNEATPTAVEVTRNGSSILSLALKPAIETGIHVIIEENCDFELINMSEMEFYRVVSNIVNNAIRAMNGEGIIIAKSYEYLGNSIIRIENNGPKIEEHHLKEIFKVGFTTKENDEHNHGYGLSIVKDLVESHNGKIYVKSSDTATEFKIVLPIIQNT